MTNHPDDATLAAKIAEAVKAVDVAVATQNERAKAAGLLLHDAHKRHPGRKAFEKFLRLCDGLQYSRAMDLIAVATDRRTFEKLKADNAARQQKHRDKKKSLHKPEPKVLPNPEPFVRDVRDVPDSVLQTVDDVLKVSAAARKKKLPPPIPTDLRITESAEISIDERKAAMADLDMSPQERAAKESARCLAEFAAACRTWLPKMTTADRLTALELVIELTGIKSKAEAA